MTEINAGGRSRREQTEQMIEALEHERDGYQASGKKERAAEVDKQLRHYRGVLDQPAGATRPGPQRNAAQSKPATKRAAKKAAATPPGKPGDVDPGNPDDDDDGNGDDDSQE